MDYILRCLFFLYSTYFVSMVIVTSKLTNHEGHMEFVATKFFLDSMFSGVVALTAFAFVFLISFA